jgi:hypothetical protein
MTKAAVIVRAGKTSTHAGWLRGDAPGFDLLVVAYEPLPPELIEGATSYVLLPGNKVYGWSQYLRENPDIFRRYDHIALMDNDLVCDAREINRCFAIGRQYKLSLWQPSLSWTSYFTYGVFLHNPLYLLRYVNFIEMMCPFFTSDHLQRCLPILSMGLETAIDRLWCRIRPDWRDAYAVIDAVQVEHSQPVGGKRDEQGFTTDYQVIIDKVEADLNVRFRGPVAYAGVSRAGKRLQGRWQMALRSSVTLAALRQSPNTGFRPVTDHIRHNLTRPIDNDPVPIPGIIQKPSVSDAT